MKIMLLGYGAVGKTYYLGSLYPLRHQTAHRKFTLQYRDFHKSSKMQDIHDIMAGQVEGTIPRNVGLESEFMVLKRGKDSIESIEITDIEGEALDPRVNETESSRATVQEILQGLGQYDGLILMVETPGSQDELAKSLEQLTQMLQFAGELLKKKGNEQVPLALVLNKVDLLPQAQGIRSAVESTVAALRSRLEEGAKKEAIEDSQVRKTLHEGRGKVINSVIKPLIDTNEIDELIETFFGWIRASNVDIPNRVFPCTSLGFDNAQLNPFDDEEVEEPTLVAKFDHLEAYGTAASFLWTIYAGLATSGSKTVESLIKGTWRDRGHEAAELLEDIRELHTSGQAYFDDDEPVWALRDIDSLYAHRLQEGAGHVRG